jgi:hypothetical protein
MIITSVIIFVVNYIFYYFFRLPNNKLQVISILLTLVFPFLINLYSIYWHIKFNETNLTNPKKNNSGIKSRK